MKRETLKMVEALIRAAVTDPVERDELLKRIAEKPKIERKDKMLTGKDAAQLAGVTRRTIARWEQEGYIHGRHITRSRVRFSRNELEDFLCENTGE